MRTYTAMTPPAPGTAAPRCDWFTWCDRQAVLLVSHPMLGSVQTCQRCADRIARADA